MPPLTVFANPRRRIATYRGVPIFYELGRYYVDMVSREGTRVMHNRLHTERAARQFIGFALARGARGAGVRDVPRQNPRRLRRNGRPLQLSKRVYSVAYRHLEDGNDYKHEFGAGVCLELLDDGSIRIYSMTGKRLWGDF